MLNERCSDPIAEGTEIACQGVADIMADGATEADAIRRCLAELDFPPDHPSAWYFAAYGEDTEAVRDAARSQLRAMLAASISH